MSGASAQPCAALPVHATSTIRPMPPTPASLPVCPVSPSSTCKSATPRSRACSYRRASTISATANRHLPMAPVPAFLWGTGTICGAEACICRPITSSNKLAPPENVAKKGGLSPYLRRSETRLTKTLVPVTHSAISSDVLSNVITLARGMQWTTG